MPAEWTFTVRSRPSVSVRMWRLRPLSSCPHRNLLTPLLIDGLDRLAVDDGGGRAGLAAGALAVGHDERVMDPIPDALALPAAQIVIDCLPRRKVVRQQTPSHPGAQEIEDGID